VSRTWLRNTATPTGPEAPAEDAETVTVDDPDATNETVRALYVTAPSRGSRHVLPEGLVTLGRGAEATIVVNDPRASRSHAALQVGKDVSLSDLGSANGTFLGSDRLGAGDARALANGQTFFIGDSALVVRNSSLRRVSSKRVSSLDDARRRLVGSAPMVVVSVRSIEKTQTWIPEAVLGELLTAPHDFMLRLDRAELVVALEGHTEAELLQIERAFLERLIGWSVAAEVRARVVTASDVEKAGDGLKTFLSGEAPLTLVRGKVIFEDPAMKALEQDVRRVAPASVNVLILGETGAGKDVVAAMLHELSTRANKPFLGFNCASVPESLLESELFGYERGAFTGAAAAKAGLLESADGGTVFLDEVGDLPLPLQAKLLRVIESREVTRIGSLKPRIVDVRFVAATNHDLAKRVSAGSFRQDFFYRLNSVTLRVPPLRERPTEIEPLARLFLENARTRFEIPDIRFSSAALSALSSHAWPGNVRELKSAVERAALLAKARIIEPSDLGLTTPISAAAVSLGRGPNITELEGLSSDENAERERIVRALEQCGGNQSRAAKQLGMSRRTLVRKIAQLQLPRPRT
jgi:two-component system, NtrC family, response regulator AtoC